MSIYQELGVKTLINAWGTVTKVGGSVMAPEVLEAMVQAGKSYVEISTLHKAAGERIAELVGAEACCITCGAAAGLAISTAACIARMDPAARLQLPDTTGLKNEVLVLKCHRILYDQAVLLSGARFVEVGRTSSAMLEEVEAAITPRTAAFFYASEAEPMRGSIPLDVLSPLLKERGIPIIVDGAAELPPKANLTRFHRQGADLVVFSGGKELRGPQSSGLILGRRDLIEACDACCCPNYGVGRSMKIDKETIAGITKAVELFMTKDEEAQNRLWTQMSHRIAAAVQGTGKATVRLGYPQEPGIQPVDILRVYVTPLEKPAQQVYEALLAMDPQIYTGQSQNELVINPQCLKEEEVDAVVEAFAAAL
ncbi:MAG: aminotransferase class V-fold PLP-dependent enzyme [Candidatus Limiplasma sp.]|nr:aminotransferase class V-fold PLP-dependent enzyme [Candidatus Limiplasma sp.]